MQQESPQIDRWIFGTPPDGIRLYVVHTQEPGARLMRLI
jgi:hypothetical protein